MAKLFEQRNSNTSFSTATKSKEIYSLGFILGTG